MAEPVDATTRAAQLDRRLRRGPLPVGSLFSPERAAGVALRGLRQRRRRVLMSSLALAACLVAAGVYGLRLVHAPSAQHATDKPASLRLADGSTVELHGPSSTVLTEHIAKERVRLRLAGGARFDVTPNPTRSFEVRSADVTVRVLGTAFSVDPEGARTRVTVERGRVQVLWQGGAALLQAGQAGVFPPDSGRAAAPGERVAEQEVSAPALDAAVESVSPLVSNARPREPSVRERARTNAKTSAPAATATELMLAADVARLSARPEEAVTALTELVRRFPRDRRAPVAAFTLGRVLLDNLGRSDEAATAFERACALWPTGPLAESALARAVEAHQRAGNAARARVLARQYVSNFEHGKHVATMRTLLEP